MSNKIQGMLSGSGAEETLNIGYGNFVLKHRVVAVLEAGSLPMKRLRERAAADGLLVDATAGRKTRSLMLLDSRHLVLSALSPQTLGERFHGSVTRSQLTPAQLEVEGGEFVS